MDKRLQGKRNLEKGRRFELKVRKDLESKGWVVAKWTNNVELDKLVSAKQGRFRKTSTGFPDFICYTSEDWLILDWNTMEVKNKKTVTQKGRYVIGVECKSNGYLDIQEKEKCQWLLYNGVFSKILVAKKGKKRGEIVYNEFN